MSKKNNYPESWQTETLENSVDALIDYRGKTPKKQEFGIPLITAKIVKKGVIEPPSEFIAAKDYDKWMVRGKPETGDVVITTEAPLGEVAQLKSQNVALAQRIVTLRGKKDFLNNDFLLYLLQSKHIQHQLEARSSGSTVKGIKQSELRKIELLIPPYKEQQKISKILKRIDDKIELNNQINQTLEAMAQALFKSWFVDFEPVKAKIEARAAGADAEGVTLAAMEAISGQNAEALAKLAQTDPERYAELKATAELFPDALVESELGEIPAGWEVKPLSHTVELIGGGTPKKSNPEFWNGDIRWFSVKDTPNEGNVFVIDTELKITKLGLSKSSTKLLEEGTTIISARGTVGKLALVGKPTAMNQSCYGVKGINGAGPFLNYFRLKQVVDDLKRNTHGAVFDTITRTTFDSVFTADTREEIKLKFEKTVENMMLKIKNNLSESQHLSDLRDSLLPKLLSGEITV